MGRPRYFLRWLLDWRTGVVVVSTVLVALLAVAVVVSAQSARDALAANDKQRHINDAQVAALNDRISTLEALTRDDNQHIAELLTEVSALQEQVRQLGGKPVVTSSSAGSSTTATTAAPQPTPTTTSTTTPPCATVVIANRCVGRP